MSILAPTSVPARVAVAAGVFVLGAAVGVCAVALHPFWWGLALGVAATLATLVALPGGWWTRLSFALGFVVMLAVLTGQRPEGDYLVAQDPQGYLLLGSGLVVLLGGIAGIRTRPATPPGAGDSGRSRPAS